jgi:hypothetical protein
MSAVVGAHRIPADFRRHVSRTRRNFRRDTQKKKNVSRRSSAGICVSGYANKIAYPGVFPLGYAHPGGKTP